MYDVGGKLLSGVKSMYVDSLARVVVDSLDLSHIYLFVFHLFYVLISGLYVVNG